MSPRASACHSSSRLPISRIGGQHLNCGGAVGDRLGLEDQVVRAGLDGHPDALAARGAQHRHRVGAGQVQQVHRRPGVPGRLDELRDRHVLRAARPGGEEVGVVPSVRRRSPLDRGRVLGVDDHLRPVGRQHAQVLLELLGRQRRELLHPGVGHEALEPEDPGVVQPAQVVDVARDRTAPEADVDVRGRPARTFRLISSPSTVVVGGMLFSGMSMIVVTPPAAAARVAVAKPSHSVRPGSLTCTWLSTRPGSNTSSSARSTVSPPSDRPRAATRAVRSRPRPRRGRRCSAVPHPPG